MKFKTVRELIIYLSRFNQDAEILTDLSFSWSRIGERKDMDNRLTTKILYIYGEYNPYYENNRNYYRIKDFIIDNYFDKYPDFESCNIHFEDLEGNPTVEYYLKHKNKWSFEETRAVNKDILEGLYIFCQLNDLMQEFHVLSIFIMQSQSDYSKEV